MAAGLPKEQKDITCFWARRLFMLKSGRAEESSEPLTLAGIEHKKP